MESTRHDVITARESEHSTTVLIGGRELLVSHSPAGPYWKDVVRALGYSVDTVWDDVIPLDIEGNEVEK